MEEQLIQSEVEKPQIKSTDEKSYYELKKIDYFGRKVPVILQNENGPCPLIAIGNVLLLRGKIEINSDYSRISNDDLISLLANCLLESNHLLRASENTRADYERNAQDAIASLPKLQYGLDVNIQFTNCKEFEWTSDCIIFDLLGIDLVHGWIVDSTEQEVFDIVSPLSYNQLMEKLVSYSVVAGKPPLDPQQQQHITSSPFTTPKKTHSTPYFSTTTTTTSTTTSTTSYNNNNMEQPDFISKPVENFDRKPAANDLIDFSFDEVSSTTTSTTKAPEKPTPLSSFESAHNINGSPSLSPKMAKIASKIKREDIRKEDEEKITHEGLIIENFLTHSSSQLTYRGLYELHGCIPDNALAVFFRNNHFATITKFKQELFVLITDSGFKNEPIVWEKLDDVDNNTTFCTSNFTVWEEPVGLPPMVASAVASVSSTLASILPDDVLPAVSNDGYVPTPEEVEQQLIIEQRILQQHSLDGEDADRELAIQLHKEELRQSQQNAEEVKNQEKILKHFEKANEQKKKKEEKDTKKKEKGEKDKDCIIQ